VIDLVISKTNLPEAELFLSERNDVIIPASGETKLDIATASCVLVDGVALGGDLNIIRSKENGVFISYYLNGAKKREISKIAQGDAVVHLYSSQLKLLKLLLPPKKGEQKKIAACLTSIAELITAHSQKLAALKAHKKGLMQALFPAPDEVDA
jgi:type I restriction enzyme, S subunit